MNKTDVNRLFSVLKTPAVLFVSAVVLALVTRFAAVDARLVEIVELAARILLVLAVGIVILQLGLLSLNRKLTRLDLKASDNLNARRRATRLTMLRRVWVITVSILVFATALTMIPGARQIGFSLFASAGIVGIAVGIAAQPVLSNLIAGLQIAFTQPIRIDDAVVVEGEWGWIEEIGLFHVVIRIWDLRRLVVPLRVFIDQPFQNWTRETASIIGPVFWHLDYRAPLEAMRGKLKEMVEAAPQWDGKVVALQVVETDVTTIQVRALASAANSGAAWELRCAIREQMIVWLRENHPEALPRLRADTTMSGNGQAGSP
ncbi:MAG: mechanosensitive ion channel family protein [Glycocaulis sp.]